MISWIFITILAYLFFSLAFFGDKLVLSGPPNPKLYVFYVGALNVLAVFLIPFAGFPYTWLGFGWALFTALVSTAGLYAMFTALSQFEVSRVMSTIGATQPMLVLLFTSLVFGFEAVSQSNLLAFGLLLAGSIVISLEKGVALTIKYLVLTLVSSLFFSLAYVSSKLVFLHQSFFQGLILISLSSCALTLLMLFYKPLRAQIFAKKPAMDKKTSIIFLLTQSAGGIANVLQSLAISLVPVGSLAIVNSLRGVQYIFLFIITLFFSLLLPNILKEDVSKKSLIQKAVAIVLIVVGLALLI